MRSLIGLSLILSSLAFGWGEVGHWTIGKVAADIVGKHPDMVKAVDEAKKRGEEKNTELESLRLFVSGFKTRAVQQAHVSNIPDIYWRNLDGGLAAEGDILGEFTHFLNPERFFGDMKPNEFYAKVKLPLSFAEAKKALEKENPTNGADTLFRGLGTSPWRAQQMTSLYAEALTRLNDFTEPCRDKEHPEKSLDSREDYPTRQVFAYAGLISHFIGDAAQPLHNTVDYEAGLVGQFGLHGYFETQLVTALEDKLVRKVRKRAVELLNADASVPHSVKAVQKKADEMYPKRTQGLAGDGAIDRAFRRLLLF